MLRHGHNQKTNKALDASTCGSYGKLTSTNKLIKGCCIDDPNAKAAWLLSNAIFQNREQLLVKYETNQVYSPFYL